MSKEYVNNHKDHNVFSIKSYENTNKTIDSLSDIDETNNSKNVSNINISNIFDNYPKEKTVVNPFIKNIEEDAQNSIEKSNFSKRKNKEEQLKSIKKSGLYKDYTKNNDKSKIFEDLNESNEESINKNPVLFEKIRSITPKIERNLENKKLPGSTRSITPIDKLERDCYEKKNEKKDEFLYKNNYILYENQNKENFIEKNYLIQNKKINQGNEKEYDNFQKKNLKNILEEKDRNIQNFNYKINSQPNDQRIEKYDEIRDLRKKLDNYTKNLEKENEEKNLIIKEIKHNLMSLEQENISLREQVKKFQKEKCLIDEETKKNINKLKKELKSIEEDNKNISQKLNEKKKEHKKEIEEKNNIIDNLTKELVKIKKTTNKSQKSQYETSNKYLHNIFNENMTQTNNLSDSPKSETNQYQNYLKKNNLNSNNSKKNRDKSEENTDKNNLYLNFYKIIENPKPDDFYTKRKVEEKSNYLWKQREAKNNENSQNNESFNEALEKQNNKFSNLKTTPDNLSSKRNAKGHISPINFPSSRLPEDHIKFPDKPPTYLNNNKISVNDRYKIDSKEREYSANKSNNQIYIEKDQQKNSIKKELNNLLQEKKYDYIYDYLNRKEEVSSRRNNDSDSTTSNYSKIINKNLDNNKTHQSKINDNNGITIQSSPQKFKKNLNQMINDITKRCQTSSNSNIQKVEQLLKDKDNYNKYIPESKQKILKESGLPKPQKSNEKISKNINIIKEEQKNKGNILTNQVRRSSLNIDGEQTKIKPGNSIPYQENVSTKKERSKSIMSEQHEKDTEYPFDQFYRASPHNK